MTMKPTTNHNKKWTSDDEEYLINQYGLVSDRAIAKRLGRSLTAIKARAELLNLARTQNFLTAADVAGIFGVDFKVITANWISKGFLIARKSDVVGRGKNRSWQIFAQDLEKFIKTYPALYDPTKVKDPYWHSLTRQTLKETPLANRRRGYWTPKEDEFLLSNHRRLSYAAIAEKLGRGRESVHLRLQLLRLEGRALAYKDNWKSRVDTAKGFAPPSPEWTPDEDQYLKQNWKRPRTEGESGWGSYITAKEIAASLNRTQMACWTRAKRLGICEKQGATLNATLQRQ
jgi:hypothetical protein